MPAPFAPLVGLALGALLAWAAGTRAYDRRAHGLRLAAAFAVLVFAPVCGYFLAFAGDWAYLYLVDSRRVPSAAELGLVALDAAAVVAGYVLFRAGSGRAGFRPLIWLAFAPAALTLVLAVVAWHRLRVDATFHQVHADFAVEPVAGGPLGYAVLWMDGMLAAGFFWTLRGLLGSRADSRSSGWSAPAEPEDAGPPP